MRFKEAGFRPADISVLVPENLGNKDLAHEKGTKAPEGAATGAASGASWGLSDGWWVSERSQFLAWDRSLRRVRSWRL
jgi:hypothetical protein